MKKGFTLIEILAVIAVLAILALIAIPSYNKITHNMREKQYENKLAKIKVGAENYADKTGEMTVTVEKLIHGNYISADNDRDEVINPVDGSIMNCYIFEMRKEKNIYYATLKEAKLCEE